MVELCTHMLIALCAGVTFCMFFFNPRAVIQFRDAFNQSKAVQQLNKFF